MNTIENKKEAEKFLQGFFNRAQTFCEEIVFLYDAVQSGRATAGEEQTLGNLLILREKVKEALSVLYADLPLDAPAVRFPYVQKFIQKGSTLIEKPHVGICIGTITKAFLELARFRALNSTRDKAWWQGQITQLTRMLRLMKQNK
jgi:hypothetical protein